MSCQRRSQIKDMGNPNHSSGLYPEVRSEENFRLLRRVGRVDPPLHPTTRFLDRSAFGRPWAPRLEVWAARSAASGLQPDNGAKRTSSCPLSEGPNGGFSPPPLRLPDSAPRAATCPLAGPVLRSQRGAGPLNE